MIALGCALGAAAGLAWGLVYPLDPASRAALAALHALAGAGLGFAVRARASDVPARRARAALLGAVAGAFGVMPAAFAALEVGALPLIQRLLLTLSGVAVVVMAARCAARHRSSALGAGAAGAAAPLLLAVAFPGLPPGGAAPRPGAWPVSAFETGPAAARRVAVLGLDGADWRVIDPMLAQGELPNLARLVARGSTAVLESVEPTYSPVVWSSVFSGKLPGRHGITGWYEAHAANRRAAFLWDLVGAAGAPSVVVNVPGTWPPSVVRGAMVSGFPMPGVLSTASSERQPIGTVVAGADRRGLVPTAPTRSDAPAWRAAEVTIGGALPEPRWGARHYLVDAALRRGYLATRHKTVNVRVGPEDAGGARRYEIAGRDFRLRTGEWTPWLSDEAFGVPVVYRARRLASDGLYLTTPFQDARAPLHPFASGSLAESASRSEAYVVEGVGWRSAADADVRAALLEELAELEAQHRRIALRLLADVPDWRLVASDHGFRADPDHRRGTHRIEGILVASGPGVAQRSERPTASVLDVTPTALAALGLPQARDMDGRPALALFTSPPPLTEIATYESDGAATAPRIVIHASTEEQLRSLGYVE
jgi:hypothetical protein